MVIVLCSLKINGDIRIGDPLCNYIPDGAVTHSDRSCKNYILCKSMIPMERSCQDNLYFDYLKRECVPQNEVQCFNDPRTTQIKSVSTIGPTISPTLGFTRRSSKAEIPWLPPTTAIPQTTSIPEVPAITQRTNSAIWKLCTEDTFDVFANPFYCNKYVICLGRIPVVRNCAYGLQWHRLQKKCMFRSDVTCDIDQECPLIDDPQNIVFYPNEEDCAK